MSISTTRGDDGATDLFGGARVLKDHPRIEALGALDELTAFLGDAKCAVTQPQSREILDTVQREIFIVMGILSSGANANSITVPDVSRLTAWVRELEAAHPVQGFIVPGSTPASAKLDIARTIARRAERRIITLSQTEPVREDVRRYLNRLSDVLFLLARHEETE